MQPLVQLRVCRGKFLDTFIQKQNRCLCLHRHLSIIGEIILKSLHLNFRGRKETREG